MESGGTILDGRTGMDLTSYEKACYLLALYRGAMVTLESKKEAEEDNKELHDILEKLMIGQEMILKLWQEEETRSFDDVVDELVGRVGVEGFLRDVTKLLQLTRTESRAADDVNDKPH